jgi:hypothetical protein
VTKFGDNGQVKTHREVDAYLKEYKRRAGADWYYHRLYENVVDRVRLAAIGYLPRESPTWRMAYQVYRMLVASPH